MRKGKALLYLLQHGYALVCEKVKQAFSFATLICIYYSYVRKTWVYVRASKRSECQIWRLWGWLMTALQY